MSYSFNVCGPTKEAVLQKISDQIDQIVTAQPAHARDRQAAHQAVESFLGLVDLPDGHDYNVSVSGFIGWKDGDVITSAGVGVSVYVVPSAPAVG